MRMVGPRERALHAMVELASSRAQGSGEYKLVPCGKYGANLPTLLVQEY